MSRRRTRRIVGVILAVLGIAFLVWTLLRDIPALVIMIALIIGAVALGLTALARSADDDAPVAGVDTISTGVDLQSKVRRRKSRFLQDCRTSPRSRVSRW